MTLKWLKYVFMVKSNDKGQISNECQITNANKISSSNSNSAYIGDPSCEKVKQLIVL